MVHVDEPFYFVTGYRDSDDNVPIIETVEIILNRYRNGGRNGAPGFNNRGIGRLCTNLIMVWYFE